MSTAKTIAFASLVALAAGCVTQQARPGHSTLICHRGESVDAPENTMPAYRMAVDRGFGFECDVYLSSDRQVFTFHDRTLSRTTGGASAKKCNEASWADEISKLDVGGWGKWKGSRFSPTRPALLSELLELARNGRYIYVEVKPGPEIVPYIRDVFARQSRATPANALFISFNADTCRALKEQMPEYKVYWLTGSKEGRGKDARAITPEGVIDRLRAIGADGVDCHFDPGVITADFVSRVRGAGYEFHVWTVDNLSLAMTAFERGAQTVTTNCAKKLLDEYLELKEREAAAP